ncbi:hypothetical protein ACFSGI_05245 [Paenibacillus nicotianae]|uniref:Internalin A n=1 Tax=Paenibacillus nicotianae TaxID=1526551 RepID=A0ABW4UV11_9BACL
MYSTIREGVIEVTTELTTAELKQLQHMSELHTIQYNHSLVADTYAALNDLLFAERSDIILRVYGFYDEVCDLQFLEQMPDVHKLSIECTGDIAHIDSIATLQQLKQLHIRIDQLDQFDILAQIPVDLEKLTLGKTASRKPDLQVLERFTHLTDLVIYGHHKHIEVIGQLTTLERLGLHSISVSDLDFVTNLDRLLFLSIIWGGTRNLNALKKMTGIQYLRLSQIKGLDDIEPISSMYGLQYLYLEGLPHITELPIFTELNKLRKVELVSMKKLKSLETLEHAPVLIEFVHREAWEMEVASYTPLMRNSSLQRAYAHLKNPKKMATFDQLLHQYDKKNVLNERDQHHENWWSAFPYES